MAKIEKDNERNRKNLKSQRCSKELQKTLTETKAELARIKA